MTSGLEDLFVQILHSEKKAQERRSILNEVKQAVANCQARIQDVQEEQQSMQGQIVTELQRWNDAELELKCTTSREAILRDQLKDKQTQCQSIAKALDKEKKRHLQTHEEFFSNVQTFMTSYDLLSYSNHQRDAHLKEILHGLSEKKEDLERKLHIYDLHQDKVNELQEQVNQIQAQVQINLREITDTQKNIDRENTAIKELEKQKAHMSQIPHSSQEYLRLRGELDQYKEETLGDYCIALQCELQDLQRKLWQKNIRAPKPVAAASATTSGRQQRFTSYGRNVSTTSAKRPKTD